MSERLDTLNRNCPAMRYLRNVIRAAIKVSESNAEQIMVNDGCDKHFYAMNENGVSEAARWALEIDGPVTIRIHRITLQAMYDGPYDKDNRAEIIMDSNERASQLIDTLTLGILDLPDRDYSAAFADGLRPTQVLAEIIDEFG